MPIKIILVEIQKVTTQNIYSFLYSFSELLMTKIFEISAAYDSTSNWRLHNK